MRRNRESKLCSLGFLMVLCLLTMCSTGTRLVAQQTPDKPAPSTNTPDVKPAAIVMPSYSQNMALLGTNQRYIDLETLQTRRRTFFLYGMGVSESYVQNFNNNSASQDNGQFLWSPHVAIINASNHSSFSIQYAPSLQQTTSGPSNRQVFQSGTISFGQPLSQNWVLQLSSANTYGTDSARLLSPQAFDVSKGVPVVDPSSAVFQFNRGKVFTTGESASLSWQTSPSQSVNFSAQESYFTSLEGGPSSSATSAQVTYSAAVTPRTSLNVGGNYHRQVFSVGGCNGYGFTVGVSRQVSHNFELSLQGGPEFETSPCSTKALSGNYGISISYPLSRKSRVALSASRSYLTNYLANAKYSDTAAVSYARQLSASIDINLNSGFARSVRSQAGLDAYVGYFAGVDLSWKLSRAFALETAYKRFEQVSGGPTNHGQNILMISLGWNPLPVRIVK